MNHLFTIYENENLLNETKILFPISRYRLFLDDYLSGKKMYIGLKKSTKSWTDEQVVNFCNLNFEFFFNLNHSNVILAIPKCSMDNVTISKFLIRVY